MIIELAENAGRRADEMKLLAFINISLGTTKEDAIEHRMALDATMGIEWIIYHLSVLLGFEIDQTKLDIPLTDSQIASLHPRLPMISSRKVMEQAQSGSTPRQILAHGLYERALNIVGDPVQVADQMQAWIEGGGCHGFTIALNDDQHDMPIFIDHVISYSETTRTEN